MIPFALRSQHATWHKPHIGHGIYELLKCHVIGAWFLSYLHWNLSFFDGTLEFIIWLDKQMFWRLNFPPKIYDVLENMKYKEFTFVISLTRYLIYLDKFFLLEYNMNNNETQTETNDLK